MIFRANRAPMRAMLASASLLASVSAASAQDALERNEPPRPDPAPADLRIEQQDFGGADATPLGVDLAGIRLIGQSETVAEQPEAGLTGDAPIIDDAALDAVLAPFLGQPLSLALARDVQAALARLYRDAGYPFVSITLPEQDVSSGVLQIRVIEFRLGDVAVAGGDPAIADAVRVQPGAPIDARALREDLDWLNRAFDRRADGVFEPGSETGLSDLGLTVTRSKPWRVYAGWSDTGSSASHRDRYFLGGDLALPLLRGAVVSYQFTGGPDVFDDAGRIFPEAGDYPDYLSHSGRAIVQIAPRQSLEAAPAFVATRQRADAFVTFENRAFELPLLYRFAISNVLPGRYWGDLQTGVEVKTLRRSGYFNGALAQVAEADVFQLVLGWSRAFTGAGALTNAGVRLKVNPGSVLAHNDPGEWTPFSAGRVTDLTYAYLDADIRRVASLGGGLTWLAELSAQYADQPLPDTERRSLGGYYAVRGYDFDDVSVDSGLIWRNALRLPAIAGGPVQVTPYVSADLGYGEDSFSGKDYTLAGAGLGADISLAGRLSLDLSGAWALHHAGPADSGDFQLQARLTAAF